MSGRNETPSLSLSADMEFALHPSDDVDELLRESQISSMEEGEVDLEVSTFNDSGGGFIVQGQFKPESESEVYFCTLAEIL